MNHKLVQIYKDFLTSNIGAEDLRLLLAIYSCDHHQASATELAKILNENHFIAINGRVGRLGKKIGDFFTLDHRNRPYENLFYPSYYDENRRFIWTLREEIVLAMEALGLAKKNSLGSPEHFFLQEKIRHEGYWLFFCNPVIWDIGEFLSKNPEHGNYLITKHHRNNFYPGQLGLIRVGVDRRSKKKLGKKNKLQSGIYAVVEILSEPQLVGGSEDRMHISKEYESDSYSVKIKFLKNMLETPLLLKEIEEGMILESDKRTIFQGRQASSWPLSRTSFEMLLQCAGMSTESIFQKVDLTAVDTLNAVFDLEARYKHATPYVKEVMSKRIERGAIAQKIKKLNAYRCQLCEVLGRDPVGFLTSEGIPYVETHHVYPVSSLQKGSLGVSNLLTVCANHHRQIHYGDIQWTGFQPDFFQCRIDGGEEVFIPRLRFA